MDTVGYFRRPPFGRTFEKMEHAGKAMKSANAIAPNASHPTTNPSFR
jgi:hypothetical protein